MLPYSNSSKFTWTSRNGKTHKQIDRILKGGDIQFFLMYHLSDDPTVIPIIIWCLQKLRRGRQQVNKKQVVAKFCQK
jgi:hypothetical protein